MRPKRVDRAKLDALIRKRWVRVSEILPFTGLSERTLRRWCERGQLPASKRNSGLWWIDLRAVKERRDESGSEALLFVPAGED